MTTDLLTSREQPSGSKKDRGWRQLIPIVVIVLGMAIVAVRFEDLLGLRETGLGRQPEWSAHNHPDELQRAERVHSAFCESFSDLRFEETYEYYAPNYQRRYAENLLGLACTVGYSWRRRKVSPELHDLLKSLDLDPTEYFEAIENSHFDFRWQQSAEHREAFIAQAGPIFSDPGTRKEFVGVLAQWHRDHFSKSTFGYASMFIDATGSFNGYVHESGERAAFQKRIFQKVGKHSSWYEVTQYLVKVDGEWRVADYQLKPVDDEE